MLIDNHPSNRLLAALGLLAGLALGGTVGADEARGNSPVENPKLTDIFAAVSNAVLDHHLAAPTRQQMLLGGARAIWLEFDGQIPPGLSRRVSDLPADDIGSFLDELEEKMAGKLGPDLEHAFLNGMLSVAPGTTYIPAREFRVQQQLRENRYEGVGIQLAYEDLPVITKTFPGGPAQLGGVQDGDRILKVDGRAVDGVPLAEVVQLLRGRRGEPLTITVQQPEGEARELDLVRDVVPFQTVVGHHESEPGEWVFRAEQDSNIAYLRIESVRSSTLHELQKIAAQLHRDEYQSLIVDLRETNIGDLRHAAMLADALTGEGTIGHVHDVNGKRTFASKAVQLFAEWPMVVLIGPRTRGSVEWLAAALKDHGRATVIGQPTQGRSLIVDNVSLPRNLGGIVLPAGILSRADGRKLGSQRLLVAPRQPVPAVTALQQAAITTHGVQPDTVVEATDSGEDTVLRKAVEVLKAGG